MSTWAHRRTKRLLSAYVDGELDQVVSATVAAHLRGCWGCSGHVEITRMVQRSVRNLGDQNNDAVGALRLRRFATQLGRSAPARRSP